jgi:UDP-N-acetylmuramoylalanine--D-glutamate ligase
LRIAGANILVVGMGRSGMAAIEFLREQGAVLQATDSRPLAEMPEAAAKLAEWRVPFHLQAPEVFEGKDLIVISPGVPADLEVLEQSRRSGTAVTGDLELASHFLQGRTIGITGSNGKTTTTALTGHILGETGIAAQVGGNIGTPPFTMVRSSRPDQWNVLELSSFQLEAIQHFHATVAVALNVTPDHLDRHHTMEAYAAAKRRVFENQRLDDFAILNADDPTCVSYAAATPGQSLWFSLTRPVTPGLWLDRDDILFDREVLMAVGDIPLRGRHNIENVMAAAAAARLAGASLAGIAAAVRTFPGVEHRLEFVRSLSGVDFYNDSKATNVDAALKAIDAFRRPLWLILGGKDKESDYTALRQPLARNARAVLLIGAAATKIARHLGNAVRMIECGTLETAVRRAYAEAVSGDTVLLAPACASFDQFENFEHRGKVFKSVVMQLEERNGNGPTR